MMRNENRIHVTRILAAWRTAKWEPVADTTPMNSMSRPCVHKALEAGRARALRIAMRRMVTASA